MSEGTKKFGHIFLLNRNGLEKKIEGLRLANFGLTKVWGQHLCRRVMAEILAKIWIAACWPKFWAATIIQKIPSALTFNRRLNFSQPFDHCILFAVIVLGDLFVDLVFVLEKPKKSRRKPKSERNTISLNFN